jgi:site-specific DNA-cytosine methylase
MTGCVAPSHGLSPATTNELQKPVDHAHTKGPHKVKFVELCSCLGSFTTKLTNLGATLVGFAEPSPEPVALLKHKFPDAKHTADLYDLESFKSWLKTVGIVDLIVLGPSCKSFSSAGKQDWGNPRAQHAPDSADVAKILRPLVVTMEITKELQPNDDAHGLYTLTMKKYEDAGYVLSSAELVRDSEIGGCQSRHRLIITWDRKDVHNLIPPTPSLNSLHKPPCPLQFALVALPNIPENVWLQGKFRMNGAPNHNDSYPTRVGTLTWGGPELPVRPGSIVCHNTTGIFWRVTSTKNNGQVYIVTTPDDPKNPQCLELSSDEVTHHAQTVTVHSIEGVAVPIKTWGEGLEGQSMLILDTRKGPDAVRPLLPVECWIMQGKPMADWQYLRNVLNISARRCGQLCGEGVPTSLASAVAQRAFSRVQQCKQSLAKRNNNKASKKRHHDPPRDDSPDSDKRKKKRPPPSDGSHTKRVVSFNTDQTSSTLVQPGGNNGTQYSNNHVNLVSKVASDTEPNVEAPQRTAQDDTIAPASRHSTMVELQTLQQEPADTKAVLIALNSSSVNLTSIFLHQGKHTWWYKLPADMKPANARGRAQKAMFDKVKKGWPFGSTESLTYAITTKLGDVNLHVITLLGNKPPPEWYSVTTSSLPTNSWLDEAILASQAKLVSFGYAVDSDHAPTMQALHKAGNISFTKLHSNKLKIDELHQVGAIPESSMNLLKRFTNHQHLLKNALLQVDGSDPDADMLHSWAAQVPNEPHPEIQQFCKSCKYCPLPFSSQHSLVPFSPAYEAPTTVWLHKQPQPKQVPSHFKPSSVEDLLLPQGLSLLRKLQTQSLEHHQRLQKGQSFHHSAEEAIVIGEDLIRPEARGIIWDLRPTKNADGTTTKSARPLDVMAPISTHLNTELLKSELKRFPDQEVLSMLLEGAQLKADIPYQIAILPHLSSLSYGYESVQEELIKMHDMGWYEFHLDIPFCPWRALPQGSTSRKYEPDRHRRTTDGGAPRRTIRDNNGTEVTPINVSCHGGEGVTPIKKSSHWPKEMKPNLHQLMHDINIILYAANQIFNEPVYSGTDDVFSFFNQIKLAPSEIWKTGLHWSNLTQDKAPWGTFVVEKVLGFGLSPNSNIAQRFANAIVYMFCKRFDMIEDHLLSQEQDPAKLAWINARKSLGPSQCRLYIIKMYTDDVKFVVVGVERLIRFLRCWDNLMTELGLLMAIAKKRQLGCASSWLGFLPCPMLAMVAIPREKVSSAITGLTSLADGSPLRLDAYRSLLGFLEHLIPFDNSGRASMFGFYNVFKGSLDAPPSTLIKPSALVRRQSQRKIDILVRHPFVSTLQLTLKDASNLLHTQIPSVAFVYTDAAKDDCYNPSIAGYLYGRWWSIPVNSNMHRLPIAALEFLAIAISFIVFHKFLRQYSTIVFSTDSQVSAMIMAADNARSQTTQNLQLLLRSLSEYQDLSMRTFVSTVHGVGNIMGDGFSRSKHKAMKAVAAELGVRITRQKIPARAYAIANMDFENPDLMIGMASDTNYCCGVQLLGEAFGIDLRQTMTDWKQHLRQHLTKPILTGHDIRSGSWHSSSLLLHLQTAYSVFFTTTRINPLGPGRPHLKRPQQLLRYIEQVADQCSAMPMSRSLMMHLFYALSKQYKPAEVTISVELHTQTGVMLSTSTLMPSEKCSGLLRHKVHLVLANCHWQHYSQYCANKTLQGLQIPAAYAGPIDAKQEEFHEVCKDFNIPAAAPYQQQTQTDVSDNGLQLIATILDLPLRVVRSTWTAKLTSVLLHEDTKDEITVSLLQQAYQPTQYYSDEPTAAPKKYLNLNDPKHLAIYILTLAEAGCFVLSMQLMNAAYKLISSNRYAPDLILTSADDEGHITFAASAVQLEAHAESRPRYHLSCFITLHKNCWMLLSKFTMTQHHRFSLDISPNPSLAHTDTSNPTTPSDNPAKIGRTIRLMASWFLNHQSTPNQQPSVMCGLQGIAHLIKYSDAHIANLYFNLLRHSSAIMGCYPQLAVSMLDAWSVMLIIRTQALRQQQQHTPWLSQFVMAVDTATTEQDKTFMQDWPNAPLPSTRFSQLTTCQQSALIAEVADKLTVCLTQGVAPQSAPLLKCLILFIESVEDLPPMKIKHIRFQQQSNLPQQYPDLHGCCQLQISREVVTEDSTKLEEVGTLTLLNNHWTANTPSNRFFHPVFDNYDMINDPVGDTMWLGMGNPIHNSMPPPNHPPALMNTDEDAYAIVPRDPSSPTLTQDCGLRILALCFLVDKRVLIQEWISLIDEAFSPPEDHLLSLLQHTHLTSNTQRRPPLPAYAQDLLYASYEAYHRLAAGEPERPSNTPLSNDWYAPQGEGWEAYYKRMALNGVIPLSPALMVIFYDRLSSQWNGSNLEILWMNSNQSGVYQLISKSPSTLHPFGAESMYAMLVNNHWIHGPSVALAQLASVGHIIRCQDLLESAFIVGMGDHLLNTPCPHMNMWCQDTSVEGMIADHYYNLVTPPDSIDVQHNCGVKVLTQAFLCDKSVIFNEYRKMVNEAFALNPDVCPLIPWQLQIYTQLPYDEQHTNNLQQLLFASFTGYNMFLEYALRVPSWARNLAESVLTTTDNGIRHALYNISASRGILPLSFNLMAVLYRRLSLYYYGRPLVMQWFSPNLERTVCYTVLDRHTALLPYGDQVAEPWDDHTRRGENPLHVFLYNNHFRHGPELFHHSRGSEGHTVMPLPTGMVGEYSFVHTFELRDLAYVVGLDDTDPTPAANVPTLPVARSRLVTPAHDPPDTVSTACQTIHACGIQLIADLVRIPYATAHESWCEVLRSLQPSDPNHREMVAQLRPLLYDSYQAYEAYNEPHQVRLNQMVNLGPGAESVYYLKMCGIHAIPISPPLMRCLYYTLLRFRPELELIIMWEFAHVPGSHHDIRYSVASPRSPFAPTKKEFIILAKGHWFTWSIYNAAYIQDPIRWPRPHAKTASSMIGLGRSKSRQMHVCGVSHMHCITPPSCNVVTAMPSKRLPSNAHQCIICNKYTHYHCGIWLSSPIQHTSQREVLSTPWLEVPSSTGDIPPNLPSKHYPHPVFGTETWWCCDCVDKHRDSWNCIPLTQEGIPPMGRAASNPASTFISTGRPDSYSVAFAATPLHLGSAVLSIARILGMDSDEVIGFLDPNGEFSDIPVSYDLPLAVALPPQLGQSLEVLRLALSGRIVHGHQQNLPIAWGDLHPQVLQALQLADKEARNAYGKETLALPACDAYRLLTRHGLCPMNPETLIIIVKAIGTASRLRLRMRHQLIEEEGQMVWRLLIQQKFRESCNRVGMIVLRRFKFYGYTSPMCCGDTSWHRPGISDSSLNSTWLIGAIGLGKATGDAACGLRSLAGAVDEYYECFYNLYHMVLRSQLNSSNFNVNLQACLDVAHLSYCMHREKPEAAVHRFQAIQEGGIQSTITYMLQLMYNHIVPLSPALMRFMYEAYCEQVPDCSFAICLIWKCNNDHVAWNYLHPPSPLAPHNKRYIALNESHWEYLTQYEVSLRLPPSPKWFVPNLILYDEFVGTDKVTDPLFWLIAAEIGTGKTSCPLPSRITVTQAGPTNSGPTPLRTQGGSTAQASRKHTSGLACALEAIANAFSEPFGLLLLVWMEFLEDLQRSLSVNTYEWLVASLVTYHEELSVCALARNSFYESLLKGTHALINHATHMAEHQIVPISPPLLADFYQYVLSSPTLHHHADTEICLLWQNNDASMARVIMHPLQPFQDLPRAFIFLGDSHYVHIPETELDIVLPNKPIWVSPNLNEHSNIIGLGCFNFCHVANPKKRQHQLELVPPTTGDGTPAKQPNPRRITKSSGWLPGVAKRIGNLMTSTPSSHSSSNHKKEMQPHFSGPHPPVLPKEVQPHPQKESTTPYEINNPLAADAIRGEINAVAAKSSSILTTKVEEAHWRYWCQYTAFLQTNSIRDNVAANTGLDPVAHHNEVAILQYAPIWISQNCMEGRKQSKPTPQSALQVISSVSRIHRRKGIEMAKVSWKDVLNGLCRDYAQEYGVSALQPNHHEPFTRDEINRMTAPPDNLIITNSLKVGDNIKWRSFHGSMTVSSETGKRIADVAQNPGVPFTLDRLTRSSVSWIINGQHYSEPNISLLCSIKLGDMAVLTSASSKNDQFGIEWAGAPSYLPYGDYNNCACRSLCAYELMHPCYGKMRGQVPLFSVDKNHSPWSTHDMSNSLKCLQTQLDLPHKSWHSFRVYIASALLASGSDNATIQAMVHWKTDDSCKLYSRIDPIEFGNKLLRASAAEVSSVQARNLPDIDLTKQLQALQLNQGDTIFKVSQTTQRLTQLQLNSKTRKRSKPAPHTRKAAPASNGHIKDDVWEVESIVKTRRTNSNSKEFLIKWKGWPHAANTWEPADNLLD